MAVIVILSLFAAGEALDINQMEISTDDMNLATSLLSNFSVINVIFNCLPCYMGLCQWGAHGGGEGE